MAKRKSKVPGTDDEIEIDEPDTEEVEVTETGKPEAKATEAPTPQTTEPVVPPPGEPGSPFGDTSQRYEGEADPGQMIKARNIQRVYEQAGLPLPPIEEIVNPSTPAITSIDPTEAEIGGSDVLLTVTGTAFSPGSAIIFNGGIEPTTLNSDTEATTIVKPSLASIAITVPVLIRSAAGAESNSVDFTFTEPVVRSGKKSKAKSEDDE
jgi:hypothetical protein